MTIETAAVKVQTILAANPKAGICDVILAVVFKYRLGGADVCRAVEKLVVTRKAWASIMHGQEGAR